jgi:hypothetical protein
LQKRTTITFQTRSVTNPHSFSVSKMYRYKLSEAEFWKRYFQSKLFNAHRASIRSSAAQHVVKDDPIFDKYLEKDDDGTPLLCILKFIPVMSFHRARAPKSTKRSLRPFYQYWSNARGSCRGNASTIPCSGSFSPRTDRKRKRRNDASRKTTRCPPSHSKIQRAF